MSASKENCYVNSENVGCEAIAGGRGKAEDIALGSVNRLSVPSCVEYLPTYTPLSATQEGTHNGKIPPSIGEIKNPGPAAGLRQQISCFDLPRRNDSPPPDVCRADPAEAMDPFDEAIGENSFEMSPMSFEMLPTTDQAQAAPQAHGMARTIPRVIPLQTRQSISSPVPKAPVRAIGTAQATPKVPVRAVSQAISASVQGKYVGPSSSRQASPQLGSMGTVKPPMSQPQVSSRLSQSQAGTPNVPPGTITSHAGTPNVPMPGTITAARPFGGSMGSIGAPIGTLSPGPRGTTARVAQVQQYVLPVTTQTTSQAASAVTHQAVPNTMHQLEHQVSYIPEPQAPRVSYVPEQQVSYLPPAQLQEPVLSFLPPANASVPETARQQASGTSSVGYGNELAMTCMSVQSNQSQSLVIPSASAQVTVQMPATIQMPATVPTKEARRGSQVPLGESFPSFLPPAQPILTSPMQNFRQGRQLQAPPANSGPARLNKSRSLDTPVCPRSLVGRRTGGPDYNIPASLGVEQPQWLRSRSPMSVRRAAAGPQMVPQVATGPQAGPQRNSGRVAFNAGANLNQCCTTIVGSAHPSASSRPMTGSFVEELPFSGPVFDPTSLPLRTQIFTRLSIATNATIVQLRQEGGLNEGMWVLSSASVNLILKLVPHERRHYMMPSEAEQFVKVLGDHPALKEDPSLAFPIKIFYCRDQVGNRLTYDLFVMRKAPGTAFSDIIGQRWFMNQKAELMRDLHALGRFVAEVHARHNMQHGDFTPSNVFYDEVSGAFTLVDLSDFGSNLVDQSDVQRFCTGIDMLATCYGDQLRTEGKHSFLKGYREGKGVFA